MCRILLSAYAHGVKSEILLDTGFTSQVFSECWIWLACLLQWLVSAFQSRVYVPLWL